MRPRHRITSLAAGLVAAFVATSALAHGLLVSVRADGETVTGKVYYSNGKAGAGEWVEMADLAQPAAKPQGMAAGPEGEFRFSGVEGRRYRVSVIGDEGHRVDSDIELLPKARGKFVEVDPTPAEPESSAPPAWAVLGGLLLVSLIPALWLRHRARARKS
ncbi:MAG: hypothetical protein U1C74_31815 [Phenylobacterium sp.]|nr:hypothetical protein [Phenylobacterium sp.]